MRTRFLTRPQLEAGQPDWQYQCACLESIPPFWARLQFTLRDSFMAKDVFDFWRMECPRRIEFNCRGLFTRPDLWINEGPGLRVVWSVAAGDIDRARRRWQRANISRLWEAQGPFTMADGTVVQAPLVGEMVP